MARAGFCESCAANVWLAPDGACANGHPAEHVSGAYEAASPQALAMPTPPAVPVPAAGRGRRRLWVTLAVLVALAVIGGACAVSLAGLRPLAGKGAAMADEWKRRLAEDYPGYKTTGFNVSTFKGPDGSKATYTFGVVPPGRSLTVPIQYVSRDGGAAECADQVLRPSGLYHDRTDALLDVLEREYVGKGKSIVAVTSDLDGTATVQWQVVKRAGFFSTRVGSFDALSYDETSDTFEKTGGGSL